MGGSGLAHSIACDCLIGKKYMMIGLGRLVGMMLGVWNIIGC